jgi:6-phosphogluconolactonase
MGKRQTVYVGTYTGKGSKGLYHCLFDPATGVLGDPIVAAELANPTFLTLSPNGRFLYAVSELRDASGRHGGFVNAFAVAPDTGQLTLLNKEPSQGAGPCHVCMDDMGRFAFVANYASGSAAMLPVRPDGTLGEASSVVQHAGKSVVSDRQEGPHAHSVTLSPDNRFALVADLGMDRVMVYRVDYTAGRLIANDPPFAMVKPGAGPRHMTFHPNGRFAYLINELDNTMVALDWDAERGSLTELQALPTLPSDFRGTSYCADVHVHPSGRFLYGSNRGHDSIVIFRIDETSGRLSLVGWEPTQGKWPRNFAIDFAGEWLLAANQDGNNIVVFRIDGKSGRLSPTGHTVSVSMPVCVKMIACG